MIHLRGSGSHCGFESAGSCRRICPTTTCFVAHIFVTCPRNHVESVVGSALHLKFKLLGGAFESTNSLLLLLKPFMF